MAYETSVHKEATQEKQKHIGINTHLQKYRSDMLPKGKPCNGHGLFNESLQNLYCSEIVELSLIYSSLAE